MERAARHGDLEALVEADLGFHEIVLARSGRPHTLQIWRTIAPRIRAYFLRYGKFRDLESIVDEHRQLLAVLETRDSDVVLPVLEEHIAVGSPEPSA
jgi:DNA-binding GntR family transcriptional regulator